MDIKERNDELMQLYGVTYFDKEQVAIRESKDSDLYFYRTYIGKLDDPIKIKKGDCGYFISPDKSTVFLSRGPSTILDSEHVLTVIRGYMPEDKSSSILNDTVLPYVNGCSTKQIFPPDRPGDPTLQMLTIPPHSSEQAHHIHSTVRVVYVLEGEGTSVVGMDRDTIRTTLKPGMVCILDPMCPHHFETKKSHLKVIPLHVWSSVPGIEANHPMYNGTHMMNQGE